MGWRINLLLQEPIVVKSLDNFQRQTSDILTLAAKPALVIAFVALYSKDVVIDKIRQIDAEFQQKLIGYNFDFKKIKSQFGRDYDERQQVA